MKNISYQPIQKATPWRKVSLASWRPTGDSSTYCLEDVEVDALIAFCRKRQVSINSFIIKAIAQTLKEFPKINSTIRWGKIYQRQPISIFFHTTINAETDDLSGLIIREAHDKTLVEVNHEFIDKASRAKKGDNEFVASKTIIGKLPQWAVKPILGIYSFVTYTLNFNLKIFKAQPDAYGSVMVTSVGSLGISGALCPISPYTRVPMVISLGKIKAAPLVRQGDIVVGNIMPLGFTFDHRIMDGIHFSEFLHGLKKYLHYPENLP
jgi:pyruvate dehydrogenase E2 component (dihydrolipoamide acetyltransferase)